MADPNPDGTIGKTGSDDSGAPSPARPRPARPAQPAGTRLPPVAPPPPVARVIVEPAPVETAAPQRPAAPVRPAAPPPLRPIQAPVVSDEPQPPEVDFTINDDDSVIMPAPPLESLTPSFRQPVVQRVGYMRSVNTRRTLIPILLTFGVGFIAAATLRRIVTEDALLSILPMWSSIVGYVLGGLLLVVAALNMLQVRDELRGRGVRP